MAKLIKCPRCQSKIDVTDLSAGSTVRCTDCGAMVRIPTGNTGKHQAVPPPPAPAPAPAAAASKDRPTKKRGMGGRQTNLFRKMSGVKAPGEKRPRGGADMDRGAAGKPGANTNMIVAASIGGLLLLGVVAYALAGKSSGSGKGGDHSEVSDKKKKKEKDSSSAAGSKSSSGSSSGSTAPYNPFSPAANVPAGAFQPGARGQVDKTTVDVNLVRDAARKAEYESMAGGGRIADIVNQDGHLLLFIIDGMLSDTEAVARTSMEAMHGIIVKRSLQKSVGGNSDLVSQTNIRGFESAQNRATEYGYWVMAWWYNRGNQDLVEKWKSDAGTPYVPPPSASPASTSSGASGAGGGSDWDATMAALRSGGGFDNQNSPEYPHFMHVKSMGKSAYPNIVKYIDHEDPAMGKAAVALLTALTGRAEERRLNDSNKAAIKTDWEAWLKTQ